MESLHPDILLQHSIEPADYKSGLVFRSAVESIRGQFIASSMTGREALVGDILENLKQRDWIKDYERVSSRSRHDFNVELCRNENTEHFAAIEVKGGEGNSINISERPLWAKEFAVWCHLDGAIVNQPAHGAHSIINRIGNELTRRQKLVDVLFFKDLICGTKLRPCPKYPGREDRIGMRAAPDIFLFPQSIPNLANPSPPVHTLETVRLPRLALDLFAVEQAEWTNHVWEVHVTVIKSREDRLARTIEIVHQGKTIDRSTSRAWRP
ncbi:MAG: hypothetical protein FJY66_01020 [Calditrichaeota bacterium]|nr:hypothetical protein [Calditrichota bacterium]